ncbi:MAG: 2-amino-4-hydroxy-6-hydroxymethyldihydropteridine diphosphokinase [Planctomycetes bacterium]|nr:2-amino-4-hydroxy-6-hydroxymethyldihydropteridine diphosphokinase [Planctomycetota bacterium]
MEAFLGVGSNIRPERHIPAALELLLAHPKLAVIGVSPFYRTAPVGSLDGDAEFVNGLFAITTPLAPRPLKFGVLRALEARLGRSPTRRRGARTIDLDILACGERVVDAPDLKLPDPDWVERPFLAIPLADLAPDFVHPLTGETAATIAARMDRRMLCLDAALTAALRGRLAAQPPR